MQRVHNKRAVLRVSPGPSVRHSEFGSALRIPKLQLNEKLGSSRLLRNPPEEYFSSEYHSRFKRDWEMERILTHKGFEESTLVAMMTGS